MKSIKISLVALLLLVFVGNSNGIAQTIKDVKGAEDANKELREEVSKKKEDAKKVTDKVGSAASGASSVGQHGTEEMTKIKEKIKSAESNEERMKLQEQLKQLKEGGKDVMKEERDDKVGDVKDGRSKPNSATMEAMRKYKEQMKDATPEERKDLEAKMREMQKQKQSQEVKDVKEKADRKKEEAYSDLKGRAYGNARATDAKKMIEKKEADMANRDRFVASGNDRVSAAKAKVQADLDSDKINAEQAAEKLAKIAKAEQSLKDYAARVKNSKKKLSDHKSTVSGYIKN